MSQPSNPRLFGSSIADLGPPRSAGLLRAVRGLGGVLLPSLIALLSVACGDGAASDGGAGGSGAGGGGGAAGAGARGSGAGAQGPFVNISAGALHACAVGDQGLVACWGADTQGSVLAAPGHPVFEVSAGVDTSCSDGGSGEITCWGSDAQGVVSQIPQGNFGRIGVGAGYACAVELSGPVRCWGDAPAAATPPSAIAFALSVGHDNACAIVLGGLECWGPDLGNGVTSPPPDEFVSVAVGYDSACGIRKEDYTTRCWGRMSAGPTRPMNRITMGRKHGCGLTAEGEIECWGDNSLGQLDAPQGEFAYIDAGWDHTCALTWPGEIRCWGSDADGRLDAPRWSDE